MDNNMTRAPCMSSSAMEDGAYEKGLPTVAALQAGQTNTSLGERIHEKCAMASRQTMQGTVGPSGEMIGSSLSEYESSLRSWKQQQQYKERRERSRQEQQRRQSTPWWRAYCRGQVRGPDVQPSPAHRLASGRSKLRGFIGGACVKNTKQPILVSYQGFWGETDSMIKKFTESPMEEYL